ncbi:methyltransferase [Anaeromyces robustus]|uniref:Methyltransferase n=1 Tax=Anaeromyces robustus TaxID=1754192 RepID=A0A1Y1WC95_9FUNG|nr:methyltransferase [Anaeromyces robustus]|eukprot:ORX71062.1 methyltransferase [Anaeromyces robustus]
MSNSVQEQFGKISTKYDEQRPKLVPCFFDLYYLPLRIMNTDNPSPRILDVGAGTGLFSSIVLSKFPQAKITLIDITQKMLNIAKERFEGNENITYLCKDLINMDEETSKSFENQFDFIISGLAIHHIPDEGKSILYKKCYQWLKKGGLFINCDQIISPNPKLEEMNKKVWFEKIRESKIDEEAIEMLEVRLKLDKCGTIPLQIKYLMEAGFQDVDILYKYLMFCVFYAYK